jgi:glycosyltransferase involved in cell wall biosynthesis
MMVIRQFRPLIGGAEKFAERLALEFIKGGYSVKVVTARSERAWLKQERLQGRLEVIRLSAPRVRAIGSLIFVVSLLIYLLRHHRQFDVIHVHQTDYAAFASALAGRLLGKPVVCQLHGSGPTGSIAQLQRSPVSLFVRWSLRTVARLVAVSDVIHKELLGTGFPEHQVVQIPNGVDVEAFNPRQNAASTHGKHGTQMQQIVYVGRLSFEKGPDLLIESFRLLAAQDSNLARLLLVGAGSLQPSLERQVIKLGLQGLVAFVGNVEDVLSYLETADLFVLPSRAEGLSMALLEAMACGLAIVGTRVSGTVEVIQDGVNGLLVEPEDPEVLAQAMKRLLENPEFAQRLGQEARRTVEENYSLQSVAERYIQLYRELLAERDGNRSEN